MDDRNNRLKQLENYFEGIFTEEMFKQIIKYLPSSKAGIKYWESVQRLDNTIIKIISQVLVYPFLVEILNQYYEEKKTELDLENNIGIFSMEGFLELLRGTAFQEEEKLGRYLLGWLVVSLASFTDQYIKQLAEELEIELSKKQERYCIKDKMTYILESLNLRQSYTIEKEIFLEEVETIFFKLMHKRHKVAHQGLTFDWTKELRDNNFKTIVMRNIKIQKDLMGLSGLADSFDSFDEETMKFCGWIRTMEAIFLFYVGFYDRFVSGHH